MSASHIILCNNLWNNNLSGIKEEQLCVCSLKNISFAMELTVQNDNESFCIKSFSISSLVWFLWIHDTNPTIVASFPSPDTLTWLGYLEEVKKNEELQNEKAELGLWVRARFDERVSDYSKYTKYERNPELINSVK